MSHKRLSRKPAEVPASDELDDLLAAPALKPSLRFLGLTESVKSSPDVIAGDVNIAGADFISWSGAVTAPTAVTPSPAVITNLTETGGLDNSSPAATASPAVMSPPAFTKDSVHVPTPALDWAPATTASPAINRKIHFCRSAQDGNSHIEQAVYQILWDHGEPEPDGNRLCRLGLPPLAREARVHARNIGTIVRRLIQKKTLEVVQREISDLQTARSYRVLRDSEIVRRRQDAGLQWVIRGRGVEFVDPVTATPLLQPAGPGLQGLAPL